MSQIASLQSIQEAASLRSQRPYNLAIARFHPTQCPLQGNCNVSVVELTFSRELTYEFAIVVALCAVALFLFPAARGSYSAVHGPVTALRSPANKLRLWFLLVLAALNIVGRHKPWCNSLFCISRIDVSRPPSSPPEEISILRC